MLDKLAPHSRIWIFQADRFLKDAEIRIIENEITRFLPEWASHGNELYADFVLKEKLFLIIGVDEKKSPSSGCSIDALNRVIKEMGQSMQIDFFNRLNIAFENDKGVIELINMGEFKKMMQADIITGQSIVFNNLITSKEELDDNWKTVVSQSWHKNLLDII